jgi:hypothetical protein
VKPEDLAGLDCLIVGSPTQKMDHTDGMRKFLTSIPHNGLRGITIVAFDTRISIDDVQSPMSRFAARLFLHRYAAKPIAAALKEKGGREVVAPIRMKLRIAPDCKAIELLVMYRACCQKP